MIKRFLKDKSGSSLVLVMICMSFLILLAGAVITTTITNIYLKSSQKTSQENFYETDSILDTISAGIQNESSEASAKAYAKALGEYNASLTAAGTSMSDNYTQDFLGRMVERLTGGTAYDPSITSYEYQDSVLEGYLSTKQVPSYIEHPDKKGQMIVDGDALVLKEIKVIKAHDVQKDYETTLTTDIRIVVPEVSTEAHSEYLNYAILADDQLINNKGVISSQITGNVYSGTVNRTSDDSTKEGIVIGGGSTLKINADQIITRGDVAVSNSSTFEIGKSDSSDKNAELWAENIITNRENTGSGSASGGNQVLIDASTYIADDMELRGANDNVELKGKYYGYNYTDNYSNASTGDKLSTTAIYSSSISINGYEERLTMSGLSELVLAGRTFISKKKSQSEVDGKYAFKNPDIELGESLAVKSGQLSYFVGAVKSGTVDGFVKRVSDLPSGSIEMDPGQTVPGFGKYTLDAMENVPCYVFTLTTEDEDGQNATTDTYLFDYTAYENRVGVPKDSNGNKQLDIKALIESGKINKAQPLKLYSRFDKTVSMDAIYYFYLNFDDSKASSSFFDLVYNKSSQQTIYDVVNKSYVDSVGIQIPSFSGSKTGYILSSGNIMYSDQGDMDSKGKANIKIRFDNNSQTPSDSFKKFAEENNKLYMSKQLALVDDYEEATKSSKWRLYDDNDANRPDNKLTKSGKSDHTNLFYTLVDVDKLTTTSIGRYSITRDNGSTGTCGYIVSNGDVKWPEDYKARGFSQDDPCFILAKGTVTVNSAKFNGLIIAGDDVEFMTSVHASSDAEAIEKLFEQDKNAASPAFYDIMSKYFRKSVDATIGTSGASADINNVTYENWKKND